MRTNFPGLVRDERTGVVRNTDRTKYDVILSRRRESAERRRTESRLSRLEEAVRELSERLSEK